MEHGFFHPDRGYWQTNSTPSASTIASYPEGTIEVPLQVYEQQPDPVPNQVTAFQARAALAAAGLLGSVNTYMASLPADDVSRLAWEHAQTFKRTSPTIAGLAPLLGMDDAQLDQLFITAAGIDA